MTFERVVTSPLCRAVETCQLAGFGLDAEVDPALSEWDYGEYEGLTTVEIQKSRPEWSLFEDGCPGGEGAAGVGDRVDPLVDAARQMRALPDDAQRTAAVNAAHAVLCAIGKKEAGK